MFFYPSSPHMALVKPRCGSAVYCRARPLGQLAPHGPRTTSQSTPRRWLTAARKTQEKVAADLVARWNLVLVRQ